VFGVFFVAFFIVGLFAAFSFSLFVIFLFLNHCVPANLFIPECAQSGMCLKSQTFSLRVSSCFVLQRIVQPAIPELQDENKGNFEPESSATVGAVSNSRHLSFELVLLL
jgi:hypothetical protein